MVGRQGLNAFASGKSSNSSSGQRNDGNPFKPKPAIFRFQDGANHALEDERRNQLKHKLIDSVKGDELERFRKTEEQLKNIKDKSIRHFYDNQNETLDDWLEVDSVVRSIADDILESFDPDRDHDGLREHAGNLQLQNEDVEAFLPQKEIDQRKKAGRNARRAINVGLPISPHENISLTSSTGERCGQYFVVGCESDGLLLFVFAVTHRFYCGQRPGPPVHYYCLDH